MQISQSTFSTSITGAKSIRLSDGQKRLASLETPELSPYNWLINMDLLGEINIEKLEVCLRKLIQHHEMLRTGINIESQSQTLLAHDDLAVLSWKIAKSSLIEIKEGQDEVLQQITNNFTQKPFNLTLPPLVRSQIINLSPNRHILQIVIYHGVFDGYSQTLFLKQLGELYRSNLECELPNSLLTYADFCENQERNRQLLVEQKLYWQQRLGNKISLELPFDKAKSENKNYKGGRIPFSMEEEKVKKLMQLAENNQVTLPNIFLAAFKLLLYRYTSQSDLTISTVTANRKQAGWENCIGFFVNTFLSRTKIEDFSIAFIDFLSKVNQQQKEDLKNSALPFGEVINVAKINRIDEVMFVFQSEEYQILDLGEDIAAVPIENGWGVCAFDLVVEVRKERDNKIIGFFEYNKDLFESNTAQRMVKNFKTLLTSIIETPEKKILNLSYLSDEELVVLNKFNNDSAVLQQEYAPIHQFVEKQALSIPNEVAIYFCRDDSKYEQISYQQLNRRANQYANFLQINKSIKCGDRIGVHLSRSIEMIVIVLAIFKVGGVLLALDINTEEKDVSKSKIKQLKPKLIFTELKSELDYSAFDGEFLEIENLVLDNYSIDYQSNVKGKDLALISSSSGSTGLSKKFEIEHEGWANWTNYLISIIEKNDNIYFLSSLTFDASIWEIFCLALAQGNKLFVSSDRDRINISFMRKYFNSQNINVVTLTPSLFRLMDPEDFPTINKVFLIGENFQHSLIDPWLKRNVNIYNGYGPSEVTAGVTLHKCGEKPITIGSPIPGMKIYINNEQNQQVPIGVEGEICIAGAGISRGYINNKEQNIKHFIINEKEERVFKTGDFAKILSDGSLEFRGRKDEQVKIFGVRVELNLVSQELCKHPNIKDAIVRVKTDSQNNAVLVAFIITKNGDSLEKKEIKTFLKNQSLRRVEIPEFYYFLSDFPLNVNGKIDFKELLNIDLPIIIESPRDELEGELRSIWSRVIGVNDIDITDTFTVAGGNSLHYNRIINEIKLRFNFELNFREFSFKSTIKEVANTILEKRKDFFSQLNLYELRKTLFSSTETTDKTIFLMPDISGSVMEYMKLANLSTISAELVGIQMPVLLKNATEKFIPQTLQEAIFISKRVINRAIPYILVGWSFGGSLAMLTGLNLKLEKKQRNVHVVVIDGISPLVRQALSKKDYLEELLVLANIFIKKYKINDESLKSNLSELEELEPIEQINKVIDFLIKGIKNSFENGDYNMKENLESIILIFINIKNCLQAELRYSPKEEEHAINLNSVTILYSEKTLEKIKKYGFNQDLGWSKFCMVNETIKLEGDHFSCLNEQINLEIIIKVISSLLEFIDNEYSYNKILEMMGSSPSDSLSQNLSFINEKIRRNSDPGSPPITANNEAVVRLVNSDHSLETWKPSFFSGQIIKPESIGGHIERVAEEADYKDVNLISSGSLELPVGSIAISRSFSECLKSSDEVNSQIVEPELSTSNSNEIQGLPKPFPSG